MFRQLRNGKPCVPLALLRWQLLSLKEQQWREEQLILHAGQQAPPHAQALTTDAAQTQRKSELPLQTGTHVVLLPQLPGLRGRGADSRGVRCDASLPPPPGELQAGEELFTGNRLVQGISAAQSRPASPHWPPRCRRAGICPLGSVRGDWTRDPS